jgi:16S rRNA C1402 N4-methylase RsmH
LVVISFHSLEDRLVKSALRGQDISRQVIGSNDISGRENNREDFGRANNGENRVISADDLKVNQTAQHNTSPWLLRRRKSVKPTPEEIAQNPRARSAKLRGAEAI